MDILDEHKLHTISLRGFIPMAKQTGSSWYDPICLGWSYLKEIQVMTLSTFAFALTKRLVYHEN